MRIVVALGGNALLRRGEPMEQATLQANVARAARMVAALAEHHEVVVTHGNGPQIGLLALASEAYGEVQPYSLDVLGAESQGMIGFMLEGALRNALLARPVATLLTTVVVLADDPGFANPTKPIGPLYTEAEAIRLAGERGWILVPDGASFRRVVPSPEPRRIVELEAIRQLLAAAVLVICAGGGGVPVVVTESGAMYGVEAVVDKDLTAALLARELRADRLLLLTDVSAVELDFGTPAARPIHEASPRHLRTLTFAPGTMGPKVEAACRFVEATGGTAAIGALEDAEALLRGTAGTQVTDAARALN